MLLNRKFYLLRSLTVFVLVVVVIVLWWPLGGRPKHDSIPKKWSQFKPPKPSHFSNQSSYVLNPPQPFNISKNQTDINCVKAKIANLSFPMCMYGGGDGYTNIVLGGGYFHSESIPKIMDFMKHHRDLTFVDIGANLGHFTLPIAYSGIHVVAVEAEREDARRVHKSIYVGKLEHTVDLFNYALSNETTTMYFVHVPATYATYFASKVPCKTCPSAEATLLNNFIPLIRRKKAYLKVDTDGSEMKIFQRHVAGKFFDDIDVPMIQMEWTLIPRWCRNKVCDVTSILQLVDFFYERGYEVYDLRTENKLDTIWMNWPDDVIFKRKDLPTDKLFYL